MKKVGRTMLWAVFFLCCFVLVGQTDSKWILKNDTLVTESSLPYLEKGAKKTENRKVLSVKFSVGLKDYDEQWLAEKERERIYGKNAETDRG